MLIRVAAGIAVALSASSVASAGDAECLFGRLSRSARDEIVARYAKGGTAEALKWQPSSDDRTTIAYACSTNAGAALDPIRRAIVIYVEKENAAADMERQFKVSGSRLQYIWEEQLSPSDRYEFSEWVQALPQNRDKPETPLTPLLAVLSKAVRRPVTAEDFNSTPALQTATKFFAAAALLEKLEGQF